jgi:NAD+ synthase
LKFAEEVEKNTVMKIFLYQMAPKVGALQQNCSIIKEYYKEALSINADICVFPEMCVTGYLAEDLFLKKDFISSALAITNQLIAEAQSACILIPTILSKNGLLYNSVIAAQNGKIIGVTNKKKLPNYGVFDEKRYFTSGSSSVIEVNGIKIGVPICEDIWSSDVCIELKNQGAEFLIVPNASPYEKNKLNKRVQLVKNRFDETKLPIIYCNQSLAHDGIIFDGRSFIYDGKLKIVGKSFATDVSIISYKQRQFITDSLYAMIDDVYEEILQATILGVREYVRDNNFSKVVIGLSGGIDSAIVLFIAVQALGNENVFVYMLPSKFTSKQSLDDAVLLANNLNVSLEKLYIQDVVDQFSKTLSGTCDIKEESITYQNIQSRTRGSILMALANNINALLLTTGNKSEYATGYATIYGDMNGAFNPIKDLYKTEIYELAKYINSKHEIIPNSIITKDPSAELAFNQKDTDSLPDYDLLDQILVKIIDENIDYRSLYDQFDKNLVNRIYNLIKMSEFKRFQSAPGVKLSEMSFDKDRRFPITNFYGNAELIM